MVFNAEANGNSKEILNFECEAIQGEPLNSLELADIIFVGKITKMKLPGPIEAHFYIQYVTYLVEKVIIGNIKKDQEIVIPYVVPFEDQEYSNPEGPELDRKIFNIGNRLLVLGRSDGTTFLSSSEPGPNVGPVPGGNSVWNLTTENLKLIKNFISECKN